MGRRNWLFAGSDEGAERAAVILTVLETAKRAGLDRRAYLHDLLVKLSSGWLMAHVAARRVAAGALDARPPRPDRYPGHGYRDLDGGAIRRSSGGYLGLEDEAH